ncbi:MAG: M20 family peptidase [Pseudomonadota bacterium]|jgi:carboxypeptidase PM20D1
MRRIVRFLRSIVLATLAVVIVLGAVVAFRTLTMTSRQLQVAPLPPIAIDAQTAAERLGAAIRFPTISNLLNPEQSADAFRGMHAHMQASFPAFHAATKRETIGNYGLLYAWQGSDPAARPIALLAHQDVVPIAPGTEGDWQAPPFGGVVRDGFIWGRGSWDDKGGLFAILEAAEMLAKQGFRPKRTIYFAFGHDEEVGGHRGAKAIAELFKSRGIKLEYVFDEGMLIAEGVLKGMDKPMALIGVAEKGFVTLTLNATATPGHSSLPPRETAIGIMSAALARLEDKRMPAEIRGASREMFETIAPEMRLLNRIILSNLWLFEPVLKRELEKTPAAQASMRTTTALTVFNAGNQENVLPGQASATVNFRLLPGDTEAGVIDHVRKVIGNAKVAIQPSPGNSEPPPVSTTRSAGYQALNKTLREVFPDAVVAPTLMLAATDSRHYAGVADNIFRFLPVRAKNDDLSRFHGTNERISIDNYLEMIRFYRRFLETAAAP